MDSDTITPFAYKKVSLATSENIHIEGWYSKLDTVNKCVIFFHGITANKAALLNEANAFRSWGYNVLLTDFRAHGNSGGSKTSFGYKETDEVQKAFEYAMSQGNKKIVLYGVSMGSAVILKAVAEDKVHPFAIIADMPFASLKDHLKARARVLGFPSQPFGSLVSFWVGVQNGYNGFDFKTYKYAKKVSCPILLEWGNKDGYVTEEEINKVYTALPANQKTLAVYQNLNHGSFLKADPVNWQKNMRAFLEKAGF